MDVVREGTDAGKRVVWLSDILWKRFSGYHYPKKFLWLVISTEPFQDSYVRWNSTLLKSVHGLRVNFDRYDSCQSYISNVSTSISCLF